jgi:xanthine dehydrogenase accessory factor
MCEKGTGKLAETRQQVLEIVEAEMVPILIDPNGDYIRRESLEILIDARMLKRDIDTTIDSARIVIGLGPGFSAGLNCHAAVETNRGIDLGRVIYRGSAQADTGIPAPVSGKTLERVLRSPADGIFRSVVKIGDRVKAGDQAGDVNGQSIDCLIDGVVRGIIRSGTAVMRGQKIGDIDPRGIRETCFRISDKANAVADGVLEAIFTLRDSEISKSEVNG